MPVHGAAEELEVVGHDEHTADRDEGEQPEVASRRDDDPDRGSGGDGDTRKRREAALGNVCLQRPASELVEGVRSDSHREKEGEQRPPEQARTELRRERGPDHDVGQMPQRVRRMEQRDVVAPTTRPQCVERRARVVHARAPHMTKPPPRLRRFVCTSLIPASLHARSSLSSGHRAANSRMLWPRKLPTRAQPGEITRPVAGSTSRT